MLYAVISDIHSNNHALGSALKAAEARGAERLIVTGDICGKGPQPFEVLETLASLGPLAVKGNADEKFAASRAARNKLSRKQKKLIAWLKGLPKVIYEEDAILVCHGSPHKTSDYIYPSVTEEALGKKLGCIKPPRVLCCGHSHLPFVKETGGVLVVNAGSAGKPIDGDPRGAIAFFELDGAAAKGEIARFEYDLDGLLAVMARAGFPKKTVSSYIMGTRNGR